MEAVGLDKVGCNAGVAHKTAAEGTEQEGRAGGRSWDGSSWTRSAQEHGRVAAAHGRSRGATGVERVRSLPAADAIPRRTEEGDDPDTVDQCTRSVLAGAGYSQGGLGR